MNKLTNYRKKVALLVVEGLSAKTKREGSPLLPSNSRNIEALFSDYERKILKTSDAILDNYILETDVASLYNTFSSSKRALSALANFESNKNSFKTKLEKATYNCKNHSSSMHLFLIYSKNQKVFNQRVFHETIANLTEIGLNKVFLHLFCDNGVKSSEVISFIEKFNRIDGVKFQISTISGISTLVSNKLKDQLDIYKSVIFGANHQILDISQIGEGDFSHLLPHTFIKNRKPIGMVNDFDTLLFFNLIPELFSDLIFLLNKKSKTFRGDKNLFQVSTISLTKIYKKVAGRKIENLIENRLNQKNLFSILSEYGLSQIKILSAEDRDQYLEGYNGTAKVLENEEVALVESKDNHILSTLHVLQTFIQSIKKDNHDLVFASLNSLVKCSYGMDFKDSITVIDEINRAIPEIIKICAKNKITFILASPFGGSDSYSSGSNPSQDINFENIKLVTVPLVLVNNSFKKKESGQFMINKSNLIDIISSKSDIFDLAPTILDLFNIDKPESFKGRSLINV